MTTELRLNRGAEHMYSFTCNSSCDLHFEDKDSLLTFAKKTSRHMAALLLVLQSTEVDSGFVSDAMELAGDLAFELQMSVELLAESEAK